MVLIKKKKKNTKYKLNFILIFLVLTMKIIPIFAVLRMENAIDAIPINNVLKRTINAYVQLADMIQERNNVKFVIILGFFLK